MNAAPAPAHDVPRYRPLHYLLILLAAALYAAFVIPQWSEAYIDFGDGNYIYIATRIADGVVVYRDILAPQPPCHLFVGAGLVKLSRLLDHANPIVTIRAFSLVLQLATFLLVVRLGGRAWGSAAAGVAAGVVYFLLPLNLWWGMAFQSEPLEIFFLMAMMNLALARTLRADLAAGVFGALAALTNATAAPFLAVLILYMLVVNPKRALRLAAPALAVAAAVVGAMEVYSDRTFLSTVVLDQTGTFPPDEFWSYALGKISREGYDILRLTGIFIVVALIGLFRFLRHSPLDAESRGGIVWFSLATMASFVYVAKGGTMDYIYCLAGPALAVLGAGIWLEMFHRAPGPEGRAWRHVFDAVLPRAAGFVFALLLLTPMIDFYMGLWTQRVFELPDLDHAKALPDGGEGANVQRIAYWIEQYSEPDDAILAPPFYAVVTGRRLWGEYSELFIWTIKDYNDRRAENPEGAGWSKTRALADALRARELPLVIIEVDQTGRLPEVIEALRENYRPVLEEPYRTLNTRLGIFIPRDDPPETAPLA
jgi:hypothetical protein